MISPINIRGYAVQDPLDDIPASARYPLAMAVTAVTSFGLLYVVFTLLHIADLRYGWLFWVEIGAIALFYAPLVVALRKSSSLVLIALLMAGAVPLDLFIEAQYRAAGLPAFWTYNAQAVLGPLHPLLRILVVWSGDALVAGPIALWLTRLVATRFRKTPAFPFPTERQRQDLFPEEWTAETVEKPRHDLSYYLLRITGFAYLGYFLLALIGLLGVAPWPEQVRTMLTMTYANPALTINTFIKLTLMTTLAFIGAHNVGLRWHCSLALLVGHLVSTVASLFFYFAYPKTDYHSFLLTSAIVDTVLAIGFVLVMIINRKYAEFYSRPREFPDYYSLPHRLSTIFYYVFGTAVGLIVPGVLALRVLRQVPSGWGAVYGYPDPQVCNTLTKYATLSLLGFMMARRELLRESLYKTILWPYSVSVMASLTWLLVGGMISDILIKTRTGGAVTVDWYFMLNVGMDGFVVLMLLGLRKMFYDVEYSISAITPSAAQNVVGLHGALYQGSLEEHSAVLQSIDRHVGGIRGRKRGLLNFPFWLVENLLVVVYGLHVGFSSMDPEHQRYFLRKKMLRPPRERTLALIPALAEMVYKIGVAVHALITLSHFSQLKHHAAIGYVPADARDRLQGDYPSARPPFKAIAPLPVGPHSPENDKPTAAAPPRPLVAPRVSTPVDEPDIPSEVDYLIVGSGAGGAVMAYRLACRKDIDASKILMIDRGPRYRPVQDFNDDELGMVRKLYKEGGLQQTKRFDLIVLQGECVGGTTVINNAICFEMPAEVREKWQSFYDIDLSGLSEAYRRVGTELDITGIDPIGINSRVEDKFRHGVTTYNAGVPRPLSLDELKANHRNILGSGLCNLGNRNVRKRSMLETYVPWAEARGVQVVGEMSAVRFLAQGRRATEVLLRTDIGGLKRVRVKKAVISAGGVIASSHFLMRSDIAGNVGQRVSCNMAFPVAFDFADTLDAFDGVQITLGALDAQNRAIFETYFNPPGSFAISLPFYFNRLTGTMERYRHLVNFGALVGSEANGVVERKADILNGRALDWSLGDLDREHIKYALETVVEIGLKAGATRAVVPTEPGIDLPLDKQSVERFKSGLAGYPLDMASLRLTTAHPQGGNGMCGDRSALKSERVVDADGRLDGYDNVFVCDASIFPTGITVNPQWTIMAMSSMISEKIP
jgi:choline dehydrogenase-like flavoprotein